MHIEPRERERENSFFILHTTIKVKKESRESAIKIEITNYVHLIVKNIHNLKLVVKSSVSSAENSYIRKHIHVNQQNFQTLCQRSFPRPAVYGRTLPVVSSGSSSSEPTLCEHAHPSTDSSRRLPGSRVGGFSKIRVSSSELNIFSCFVLEVLFAARIQRGKEGKRKEI